MAKLLHTGDSVSTTVSVSMPAGDDRGSPWVKAECSATTTVQKGERAKDARKRVNTEAWDSMERLLKRLMREMKAESE